MESWLGRTLRLGYSVLLAAGNASAAGGTGHLWLSHSFFELQVDHGCWVRMVLVGCKGFVAMVHTHIKGYSRVPADRTFLMGCRFFLALRQPPRQCPAAGFALI